MSPDDNGSGNDGPGTREFAGPHEFDRAGDRRGPLVGIGMGQGPAGGTPKPARRGGPMSGSGPAGLTAPAVQLAHALRLLQQIPPSDCSEQPDPAEEAQRLIVDALFSVTGAAGLSVPTWAPAKPPKPTAVDPELEAAFLEFDEAREAWRSLPGSAETWHPRPEVDRYIAAEESILNLADAGPEVLRRQASLLLDLVDELSDQTGVSTANAIANVAQGLLVATGD